MTQPRNMLRDGRNIIPVGNSDAKCLLENWVEERSVKDIDPEIKLEEHGPYTSRLQVLIHGHKGVLTTDFKAKAADRTTVRDFFTPPKLDMTRKIGSKRELMYQKYAADICKEMSMKDLDPPPEPTDYRSVKMKDYDFEFTPPKLFPTRDHNYRTEQPVTFWTEHKDKIHGLTAVKTRDTVFRRNDAFTKPMCECWEEPKPYDLENYSKT